VKREKLEGRWKMGEGGSEGSGNRNDRLSDVYHGERKGVVDGSDRILTNVRCRTMGSK
jgi:hypothetical protein